MLKKRADLFIQFFMILGIIFGLVGTPTQTVRAATCTWEGWVDTDWFNASNWDGCYDGSANPVHPGVDHDVVIPAGKSRYPRFTVYQGAVAIHSLIINAGGQITVDEQTGITATQVDNYGTITIVDVGGHWLRINAPFNNYGTVAYGTEPALILYESGTHTGSFSGRQLSFSDAGSLKTNTFEDGSTITVEVIMIQENHAINLSGDATADKVYIRSGSTVTVTSTATVSFGEIILQGGEYIQGSYTVSSGETFSGTGTVQTDLTNSGTVSPGSSPGTITVSGNYSQEASGTLAIELGGTTPDTEHDQLAVTGAATLGGTLEVTLINDFSPELGDIFTIMTYGSVSGSFASASLPTLDPGLKWGVSLGATTMRLIVEADGGSISGEVNYTGSQGTNPITVGLFTNPNDAPVHTVDVGSATSVYPYTIAGIPDGTYYIGALMDLNGNHQPDPDEPFAWYSLTSGGAASPIVISSGTPEYTDIDIQLNDPLMFFIPLILR